MTDDNSSSTATSRRKGSVSARATRGFRGGIAAMLVGAVLVSVGALSTTSAAKPAGCPDGTTMIARYHVANDVYQADSGSDVVTIHDGTKSGGTWTSTKLVSALVVKGGPSSAITTIDPAQLAGVFDSSQLQTPNPGTPDILGVEFCGPDTQTDQLPPSPKPYTVTLAARACPTYGDIIANRSRNNIQESLEDLGPDTNYAPEDLVNPAKEAAAPQDSCSPLTGWNFQWGTAYTGPSVSTANLSTVTGENSIASTTASAPELDAAGNETGRNLQGAVVYTLTEAQAAQAATGSLWIQGGTKSAPLGDGTQSFGALRCATDNYNGDNVEYIRYPDGSKNVFCFAYYLAKPAAPVSITVRKQLADGAPGGTTFEFTGDTSFIPGGNFSLRPDQSGSSAEIEFVRAADVAWTVSESVPAGWTLASLECTAPTSGRQVVIDGTQFTANLAAGDSVVCTYTNDKAPYSTTTSTTESSTTTDAPTTTTVPPTTAVTPTTEPPTTTSTPPTTIPATTVPSTTAAPTTSEVSPTSELPTTTEAAVTTVVPATVPTEVGGEVRFSTKVIADDGRATPGALAFTGGSASPLLALGIVLLIAGATVSAVSWQRRRTT